MLLLYYASFFVSVAQYALSYLLKLLGAGAC